LRADDVRLADQVELEASHGAVRLDWMAQEPAGAQFGAKTALVARAAPDPRNLFPILPTAPHHDMVAWQHDDAAGGFIDQGVMVLFEVAHHHAADEEAGVGDGRAAGRGDALGQRRAERHAQRNRLGHGPRNGEIFFGNGLFGGQGDVQRGLDVDDDCSDGQWDAARRNDPP